MRTLDHATALFKRWQELVDNPSREAEELEWTANELRTGLKSIDWDLDDLSETVTIVEQDPARFKIPPTEIAKRKEFIAATRAKAKVCVEEPVCMCLALLSHAAAYRK